MSTEMSSAPPSGTASRAYVRAAAAQVLPPPVATSGLIGWLRTNLFSSPGNTLLTLLALLIAFWIIPGFVRFLITDAVWSGADREACVAKGGVLPGACWAFVKDRLAYFIYGAYPVESRWRADLFFLLGALGIGWLLWLNAPRRDLGLVYFLVVLPLAVYGLLSGRNPLAFLAYPYDLVTGRSVILGLVFAALLFLAGFLVARSEGVRAGRAALFGLAALVILTAAGLAFERLWGAIGLAPVDTARWGGLMVTLVVAGVGIVASLPLGILLALGRRSKLPVIKFFSVLFIEFVRGVPLITVLFMANTMLPLFLPDDITVDKLLRALVGIALFASAYMAEVVRAGLQALPKGQYEGAMAVGLGYWQMMRLIILPQALKVTIPNIVNTYIGLFKDTSLLLIVGIFDFLKAIETARIDPQWAAPTVSATGYAFAAIVYFIFCYGMASYARATERRLSKADKR
ncbi:MAG: amino acid ABC transporter permease [Hyphomicrobiales bacterium]|uniref:amino acid ABC transporter permease n=1 Tax=Rhabdaerophilum calidifontis TaxID=2604328 RepID=UPI001FE59E22|nr:amino acid ABC transporter permease [Rhabdaerophilum calidifontis]MCA1999727.1 amino acid ABC transporter permease [Hyphomicrobiales bacterium]